MTPVPVIVISNSIRSPAAIAAALDDTRFSTRNKRQADARDIRALGAHVGLSSGGRSPPELLPSPD